MNTLNPPHLSRALFVTCVIIALLALVLITPQGRAFAQNILHFFIRSESDAIPVPTSKPMTWVDLPNLLPTSILTSGIGTRR